LACRTDQAGYYVAPEDNFGFIAELMNMVDYPRDAVLTVTWEYIPSVPAGFDKTKALWLNIGGCYGDSEQPAKANQAFQYTDPIPWTSNLAGRITHMVGHLHDGGVHLTITKNNKTICDSVATYGQDPAYIDGGSTSKATDTSGMSMMSSMDMSASSMEMGTAKASSTGMPQTSNPGMAGMNMSGDTVHISKISTCSNAGAIAIGDILSLTAYYDSTKYPLMTYANGSLVPIMGISLLYVADTNLTTTAATGTGAPSGTNAPSGLPSTSEGNREIGSNLVHLLLACGLAASILAFWRQDY
jgi:hypothetical protein